MIISAVYTANLIKHTNYIDHKNDSCFYFFILKNIDLDNYIQGYYKNEITNSK